MLMLVGQIEVNLVALEVPLLSSKLEHYASVLGFHRPDLPHQSDANSNGQLNRLATPTRIMCTLRL